MQDHRRERRRPSYLNIRLHQGIFLERVIALNKIEESLIIHIKSFCNSKKLGCSM